MSSFLISLCFLLSVTQKVFCIAYANLKVTCLKSHVPNLLGMLVRCMFQYTPPELSNLGLWVSSTTLAQNGRVAYYQEKK